MGDDMCNAMVILPSMAGFKTISRKPKNDLMWNSWRILMDIEKLIFQMRKHKNIIVRKPSMQPNISKGHTLPTDVKEFYELCGGVSFYTKCGGFPINVLSPLEVQPANIKIIGKQFDDDISSSWYLIADALDGNYISIDFEPSRLGRCYESFEYSHAIAGNCPILAVSFTQLLMSLFCYEGDYFFWKEKSFNTLGDAYK